jgi:hypothetical protein
MSALTSPGSTSTFTTCLRNFFRCRSSSPSLAKPKRCRHPIADRVGEHIEAEVEESRPLPMRIS